MLSQGQTYRLGRFFGVQTYVHLFLLIYLGFSLVMSMLEQSMWRIVQLAVLFFSVYLHELGHALSSKKFGAPPLRIVLHPFGGVAVTPPGLGRRERFWVVAWGPIVNVLLAAIGFTLQALGPFSPWIDIVIYMLIWVNVVLCVFNILPIYPLDGGKLLRLHMARRQSTTAVIQKTLPISVVTLVLMLLFSMGSGRMGGFMMFIVVWLMFENYREYQSNQGLFSRGFFSALKPRKGVVKETRDRAFLKSNSSRAQALYHKAGLEGIHSLSSEERRFLDRYTDAKQRAVSRDEMH